MMLDHMQPGDIVTHCYAYSKPMIDSHNKVHSYFYEARNKGILFDVGHGAGSFSFKIAKNAISQKFLPDTISTDMHVSSLISNHATMPEVMSKLLACGMDLNDVVQKSTYDPSKKIGRSDLGSLSESTIADIAVLKISEGDFGLTDNGSGIRVLNSNKRIECEMTIKDGKILWDINGRSKDDWESTPTPYQISNV
ncbi:MAG: amidohydrolase family protein, partial [Dehalococcoidia bacterium]|nr:amidohydrolase family protein [Dehalococcoidia bacterium]